MTGRFEIMAGRMRWLMPLLLVPVLLVGMMAGAGLSAPARAANLEAARAAVVEIAEVGIREVVAADIPHPEKIARFRSLFDRYFDMTSIARFVIGQNWRTADAAQQDRFIQQFRELNVYTWARRFKDYNGQQLSVVGVQADGDSGAWVDTMVQQKDGQKPLVVRWRLRERDGGWRVVDLIVEGVSMAITYRSEYTAQFSDSSMTLGRLNDMIARQVEQMRGAQAS